MGESSFETELNLHSTLYEKYSQFQKYPIPKEVDYKTKNQFDLYTQ